MLRYLMVEIGQVSTWTEYAIQFDPQLLQRLTAVKGKKLMRMPCVEHIPLVGRLGAEQPQMDLPGRAAALAKTIAAEQDHVTVAELSDWIIKDQRDYELVDIRDKADFDAGHIQGARACPAGRV